MASMSSTTTTSVGGIYYAAVIYNRQILCSCANGGGSLYESSLEYIIPQVDTSRIGDKQAFSMHDGLVAHVLIAERGVVFACIAPSAFPKQRAQACLDALLKNFESANLFSRVIDAGPYGLMSNFSLALQVQIEKYSKVEAPSAGQAMLQDLQAKVEDVKVVMVRNVQKIVERGERLEDLQDRAESLEMRSSQFSVTATRVRKRMWWENMKMKLILSAVVIVIVFIIIMAILGSLGVFNGAANSSGSSSGGQQQQQQVVPVTTKAPPTTIAPSTTPPTTSTAKAGSG